MLLMEHIALPIYRTNQIWEAHVLNYNHLYLRDVEFLFSTYSISLANMLNQVLITSR